MRLERIESSIHVIIYLVLGIIPIRGEHSRACRANLGLVHRIGLNNHPTLRRSHGKWNSSDLE